VSVARGLEVEIRVLTEICGLRMSVEAYIAPKSTLCTSTANALDICRGAEVMHTGVLLVVRLASQGSALT